CGGKGGSMHIADMSKGMLGANAIVGGSPPIAVGAALTQKTKQTGKVAVAFSGDGASNQGTTLEAMNMAVVLKVPAIFVFENNGYGEFTAAEYSVGADSIAERARSFGMVAEIVDGVDFFAVQQAMTRALEHCRSGKGPYTLELRSKRFLGHFVGDPQVYRSAEELEEVRKSDPVTLFKSKVLASSVLSEDDFSAIEAEVDDEVERSVEEGLAAAQPALSELTTDVYIRY
ncbi:MAG: thiamine pyrophosphate-dependent dehydrogenase E1 component subunit alpha, partial [Betaproteobacteria bacterium]|nr:thiamine pyrophosphate-dependent dehydrogenase E1 component subunit alpha [Betaproteobacteria bacterium]